MCSNCGEHRWAFDGYCLGIVCAGDLNDPEYPLSKPAHLRELEKERRESKASAPKKTKAKKVKMPRKGTRRSTELWYESQGKVAPWLEKQNDPNAS